MASVLSEEEKQKVDSVSAGAGEVWVWTGGSDSSQLTIVSRDIGAPGPAMLGSGGTDSPCFLPLDSKQQNRGRTVQLICSSLFSRTGLPLLLPRCSLSQEEAVAD